MENPTANRCDGCGASLSADQLVAIRGRNVCAKCKPDLMMDLKSGLRGSSRVDPKKAEEIRGRMTRYNLLSLAFGLPGIILQFGGPALLVANGAHGGAGTILLLREVGAPLLVTGFVFYALVTIPALKSGAFD